jgi:signal transduction histidine kinase
MLPLIFLTPSIYNVTHFDLASCEAVENTYFSYYYYALGGLAFIGILFLVMYGWNRVKSMPKKQIVLMATGLELFLASFFSLGLISSYLDNYSIEFYGLFGMVVFVAFLSYLIVKFKAFNIRLIGSQALVWALVILIGSQFFFIQNNINRVLTGITVLLSAFVGLMIVKSVKKEIKQKERIESLADSLRSLNDRLEITNSSLELANERLKELDHMKSEFVSLATHQIRGPLAAIKGYVSLMIEGDYGQVPATFVEPLDTVFKSTDSLSKMVTDFLDVSRIDLGQMKYEFTDFDFRDLVEEVSKELKIGVEAKGLEYKEKITHGKCPVKADRTKLKQVLINLIDNSSKYTEKGGLEVSVEKLKEGNKILFAVKDSGVGISKATLPVLFQRFSRAKNANDVNILGTGLGLYIAKKMVEANHGKIWAESEGEGKGAEFYVELNLVE